MQNRYSVLMKLLKKMLIPLVIGLFLVSCNSPYVSKKRGYFNIELPKHAYRKFDLKDFPYSFEYPVYAEIIKDSTYFDVTPENPFGLILISLSFTVKYF